MYREKIKLLDCTIRDGGLINNHEFEFQFVRNVYKAVSDAGVDYMEMGYKNSKRFFSLTSSARGNSVMMMTSSA